MDDGIHLRFFFSPCTLGHVLLPYIIDRGRSYGTSTSFGKHNPNLAHGEPKKIVVEFSSPNIGKKFDGLHLRSTIIGAYLASLYESMGWAVTRMNFLGDWGQPIGLLAAGWSRFGSEDALSADPLRHLLDVYAQIDELSRDEQANSQELPPDGQLSGIAAERDANVTALEDGDPTAVALWKRFREASIERYTDLYARMNIRFDDYSGESEVNHETIAEVESKLQDKIIFDESKDGWIIDFSTHETRLLKSGHAKIRNRRGLTTYLLRDIAAVLDRSRKYGFDKLIYVVSARQDSHFQQLFASLELMGHADLADRLQHVGFNEVKGLVPQEGTRGLLLSDILDQCRGTVINLLANDPDRFSYFQGSDDPEFYDRLGAIALMAQDLAIRRKDELIFDIPNIGNVEEDSGLDIQSCVTKLSIKLQGVVIDREDLENSDYSLFEDESFAEILRLLIQFPAIIKSSLERLESSPILTYLFRLIAQVEGILEEEGESEASGSGHNVTRLAVYQAIRQVLENGMRIIGFTPMEAFPFQEHSGIVPVELPTEVTTEEGTSNIDSDNIRPEGCADPIPAEPTADESHELPQSTEGAILEASAEATEPTGVAIEAAAEETEPTGVTSEATTEETEESTQIVTLNPADTALESSALDAKSQSVSNPDPEPQMNVRVEIDDNVPNETAAASEVEPAGNTQIETDEPVAVDAPSDETLAADASPDPETLDAPANDTANPAEDRKHEASESTHFEHYESTSTAEGQHVTMPDHVATIEAH